ncbi:hypothetical protein ACFWSF_38805 [Streptomyces sp. NPDC058611]|uniref:hypothetical protein n=1 Tax=unclassified Streptomyces TaxID=2593676 RepID=UPI0036543609
MPGKVADFLRSADLEPPERTALEQAVTVRRGQGYTLRVSAVPSVHHQLLARCQPLDGGQGIPAVPAQRKGRREYENRISTVTPTGPRSISAPRLTDVPGPCLRDGRTETDGNAQPLCHSRLRLYAGSPWIVVVMTERSNQLRRGCILPVALAAHAQGKIDGGRDRISRRRAIIPRCTD